MKLESGELEPPRRGLNYAHDYFARAVRVEYAPSGSICNQREPPEYPPRAVKNSKHRPVRSGPVRSSPLRPRIKFSMQCLSLRFRLSKMNTSIQCRCWSAGTVRAILASHLAHASAALRIRDECEKAAARRERKNNNSKRLLRWQKALIRQSAPAAKGRGRRVASAIHERA